jgi:hypothetical protein
MNLVRLPIEPVPFHSPPAEAQIPEENRYLMAAAKSGWLYESPAHRVCLGGDSRIRHGALTAMVSIEKGRLDGCEFSAPTTTASMPPA